MSQPLLSKPTAVALERFITSPSHAVLIVAPAGAGKTTIARYIASQLLQVDAAKLGNYPHFKQLSPEGGKTISIESVREVIHFLSLKTASANGVGRVVLIEDAQFLTPQAQNALLKTIEEPPVGTVIILTAPNEQSLLPTICSRVQVLHVVTPDASAVKAHFKAAGYSDSAIAKAILMSGGLPGLCAALLADDASHPLVAAAARARDLLQKSAFERLTMTEEVVKDKQAWLDTLLMLERMAQVSLQNRQAAPTHIRRWHAVLKRAHEAYTQTQASGQVKLVALNLMLTL